MTKCATIAAIALILCVRPGASQSGTVPIYHVTVVERTTKAINYLYRAGPTRIDFRGTVLLPQGKGDATVESKQGRTEIDARFENLLEPVRYGREYLTYVLWALTPDGRPHNIGELVANSSNKAHVHVTTDLQAFALIVTAEPYSAVRQPGDVVVLENEVRPDTVGKIEEVTARYELLPRGHYSWEMPSNLHEVEGPKVSMRKYEELLELYQAQNAVGIARVANAEQYAPNTFAKAQQLLLTAQQLERSSNDNSRVIQTAREAAEAAEDARIIAERRKHEDDLANAQSEVAQAQKARAQAEAEVQRARGQAEAAQAQAAAERAAREQAEADAESARQRTAQAQAQLQAQSQAQIRPSPAPAPVQIVPPPPSDHLESQRAVVRMQLMEQLNGVRTTRDTPRGLVVTIPGAEFSGATLRGSAVEQLARIARFVAGRPGLHVDVEGHTDSAVTEPLSWKRAEAARQVLVEHGLAADSVSFRGLGNSRPLTSNATTSGREENQRLEIVISGGPIGNLPFWDRTYPLSRP